MAASHPELYHQVSLPMSSKNWKVFTDHVLRTGKVKGRLINWLVLEYLAAQGELVEQEASQPVTQAPSEPRRPPAAPASPVAVPPPPRVAAVDSLLAEVLQG